MPPAKTGRVALSTTLSIVTTVLFVNASKAESLKILNEMSAKNSA